MALYLFGIDTTTGQKKQLDMSELLQISGTYAITGVITPAALALGDNNDYNPTGLSTASIVRVTGDAGGSNITGILAQESWRRILILNVGATNLDITSEDVGSTAANRIITPGGGNYNLRRDAGAELIYDSISSRWRFVSDRA